MITPYTSATPNGRKIPIAVEELGLPYETRTSDIPRGEQFTSEFLALNPNHRMPVIIDDEGPDGTPIMEVPQ